MDRNTVKQKEKALFERWKAEYKKEQEELSDKKDSGFFVTDGMVNPEKYENIVFVLKEVNGAKNEWDLKDMLNSNSNGHSWNNIARWTRGLTCGSIDSACEMPWDDTMENLNQSNRDKELEKSPL